jgi:hypothetical protein
LVSQMKWYDVIGDLNRYLCLLGGFEWEIGGL